MTAAVALWRMSRPLMLMSVLLVYALGLTMATTRDYNGRGEAVLWGGAALLLISISLHLINEYADHATDAQTTRTHFSGGSGVLPGGLVSPRLALWAAWTAVIGGLLMGLVGVVIGMLAPVTLPILLIGAVGGWLYSVPPLKLVWRGWGEITNAFLGGFLLTVYGYVVWAGQIEAWVLWATLPFALADFLNLLATHWADRAADAAVGKRTLAAYFSAATLRRLYATVALLIVLLLLLYADRLWPAGVSWASLIVSGPLLAWGWWRYTRQDAPTPSVVMMVALLLVQWGAFGVLMAV